MLIIFDLDKTSIYCPIADFMDRFIPQNKTLKQLYYKNVYPFIHTLEIKFSLCKINEKIYNRVKAIETINSGNISYLVLTARHETYETYKHVDLIFKEFANFIMVECVAQSITELSKADFLENNFFICDDEEIVMFDDNYKELLEMKNKFGSRFTGFKVKIDKYGNEVYALKC